MFELKKQNGVRMKQFLSSSSINLVGIDGGGEWCGRMTKLSHLLYHLPHAMKLREENEFYDL